MSKEDLTVLEQHMGTVAWLIVIALLTWNVNTTNTLQITTAEAAVELKSINKRLEDRTIAANQFDSRLDALERQVDRLLSKQQ